ncbi:MAG: exodeoxyribonuclease VII large subunit [Gammaproteobacteria bacterium]|nr:exodeoxyribonuclease VII large subunit [Gammaproteobacteria bacterium]
MTLDLPLDRDIYTVTRLNREARDLLEIHFPVIWLEGEVSNLSRPASGHWYFSLKDANAQVRCAFFRNRSQYFRGTIANGQRVLVNARVSLYEARGDYQLIVEYLEEAGAGALRQAYDELRRRLEQEGLFAIEHKQALPAFPRCVGVITSPTGAAIRDVLSVLKRRFPALPVLVYPVPVQGEGAAQQIAQAIRTADERQDCDVLLLVRGGGSLEDLWSFNEEVVVRAIYACHIPIVCGVGHETDVTIADFVADLRAATPSAAAELVSPDRGEWLRKFTVLEQRLTAAIARRLANDRQRLTWLVQAVQRRHPGRNLQDRAQRLDELEQRLRQGGWIRLERARNRAESLAMRVHNQAPGPRIEYLAERRRLLGQRLQSALRYRLERATQRLEAASRTLHAVSPLQTLGRGYAIVRRHDDGTVVQRADQVRTGEQVEALLAEGRLLCQVIKRDT